MVPHLFWDDECKKHKSFQPAKKKPPLYEDHRIVVIDEDEEEDDEVGAPADGDSAANATPSKGPVREGTKTKDAKVFSFPPSPSIGSPHVTLSTH